MITTLIVLLFLVFLYASLDTFLFFATKKEMYIIKGVVSGLAVTVFASMIYHLL